MNIKGVNQKIIHVSVQLSSLEFALRDKMTGTQSFYERIQKEHRDGCNGEGRGRREDARGKRGVEKSAGRGRG